MLLRWLFSQALPVQTDNNGTKKTTQASTGVTTPAPTTPTTPPTQPSAPPPTPPPATTSPPTSTFTSSHVHETTAPPPHTDNSLFSRRSLRQMGLMLGGAGFFYWSVMVSRRAALRHQRAAQLRFFQGNHFMFRSARELPPREPLVAVEALGLATLNTLAFGIMAAGGVAWAFDISSLDDLRRYARRSVERSIVHTPGSTADEEAEAEVVEWFGKAFGVGGAVGGEKEERGSEGEAGDGEAEEKK